jgi:two-component system LytT family response regulator
MITAIIIDDEIDGVYNLKQMLQQWCHQVRVVATANDITNGIELVRKHAPDVLFLDVEMPFQTGFDLLQQIEPLQPEVIFVTAYDKYATKAFRFNALDYLLKPVDPEQLIEAVEKAVKKKEGSQAFDTTLKTLLAHLPGSKPELKKLAIPSLNCVTMVNIDDIVKCIADNNYTTIHLSSGDKIVACKTLGEYEELLSEHNFFRPHKSSLINLDHIRKYVKEDGGYIIMSDGSTVEVSKRKKAEFLEIFK